MKNVPSPALTFPAGITSPRVSCEMPARPNMFLRNEAKGNFVKTTKPAGPRRRGQDGRNLIRKIQPLPSLQERHCPFRERAEKAHRGEIVFRAGRIFPCL